MRDHAEADAAATESMDPAQLHMRVIALENLLIAMLAGASVHQRAVAEAMGRFISPRPGHTPHPLTLRAAQAMDSLLARAERFRPGTAGDEIDGEDPATPPTSSTRP